MSLVGIDVSNYTSPLTPNQVRYIRDNGLFVIIGLQDTVKALAFKEQLAGLDLEYYLDRAGRNFKQVADVGTRVWIDIEVGCFVTIADVDAAIADLQLAGYRPGIYCNKTSLGVLGIDPGVRWAHLPLWYADYRQPDLSTFRPFNGWEQPTIWQYSDIGVEGINCDLNVSFEEAPAPEPVTPPPEPLARYFIAGDPHGGIEKAGRQLLVWNEGVCVLAIGDYEGAAPGQLAKLFGDEWFWLRKGSVLVPGADDTDVAAWSRIQGD